MSKKQIPDSCVEDEGYSAFLQETRAKLHLYEPHLTKIEIYHKTANLWEQQSSQTKMQYRRKAKLRLPRKKKKERQDNDTSFDNEDKVKRISAYSIFVQEQQQSLKITNPNLTLSERTQLIQESWKGMSKLEKSIYENKAKCFNRNIDKFSSEDEY